MARNNDDDKREKRAIFRKRRAADTARGASGSIAGRRSIRLRSTVRPLIYWSVLADSTPARWTIGGLLLPRLVAVASRSRRATAEADHRH
jgi:hypothetical protein